MYTNPHGPSCPWYSIAESQGAPNIKWCEETLCQWVSEPANTWSNIGYLIVGIVTFYLALKNKEDKNLKMYGPIIFIMGAMSLFYHMSNFYGSQILDFVGMFLFVGWAIGVNLIKRNKIKTLLPFLIMFTIANTAIMHVMYLKEIKFQALILVSAFIIIFTEINRKSFWFLLSLGFLIGAFSFSIMDGQRIWCDPQNHVLQGHAVWHILAAFATFTVYKHYTQKNS
jgi:hypothetical protein